MSDFRSRLGAQLDDLLRETVEGRVPLATRVAELPLRAEPCHVLLELSSMMHSLTGKASRMCSNLDRLGGCTMMFLLTLSQAMAECEQWAENLLASRSSPVGPGTLGLSMIQQWRFDSASLWHLGGT